MDVVKEIGLPAMLEQTAEECVELAHACLKYARYLRGENPTPRTEKELLLALKEEMADVMLSSELTRIALDMKNREVVVLEGVKYERMINRIKEMKEKRDEQSGEKKESEE